MRCSLFVLFLLLGLSAGLNKRLIALKELSCADIISILDNEREVNYYTECALDSGPCDFIGAAIKQALLDFKDRKQLCQGCDDDQSGKANYIFDRVSAKSIFKDVAKKYNVPATFKPAPDAPVSCVGESANNTTSA